MNRLHFALPFLLLPATDLLADTRDGPLPAALFSLAMLVGNNGKQFSLAELAGLLTGGGFADVRATHPAGYYWLSDARRPCEWAATLCRRGAGRGIGHSRGAGRRGQQSTTCCGGW